jgi:hypothetical protein
VLTWLHGHSTSEVTPLPEWVNARTHVETWLHCGKRVSEDISDRERSHPRQVQAALQSRHSCRYYVESSIYDCGMDSHFPHRSSYRGNKMLLLASRRFSHHVIRISALSWKHSCEVRAKFHRARQVLHKRNFTGILELNTFRNCPIGAKEYHQSATFTQGGHQSEM